MRYFATLAVVFAFIALIFISNIASADIASADSRNKSEQTVAQNKLKLSSDSSTPNLSPSKQQISDGYDVRPSRKHDIYFAGTDYELHVYTIKGRRDGKTILMLGGIQGDEPGGFLSADLYADIQLEQGNLIVIPRGNLLSVILNNRGADGDMNRLFIDEVEGAVFDKLSIDYQVVHIIMSYLEKADLFLNLHDGWGYHSDVYISAQRNPNRFGQCIIVDAEVYTCDNGAQLELGKMAREVLESVNTKIDNKEHHLAFFNTYTDTPQGRFPAMKKTATWFNLRKNCTPAFGIESSKNLSSLEDKVLYHNYVINEFMKKLDILPEMPPIYVRPATLKSAIVMVNDVAVDMHDGDKIHVNRGDILKVIHVNSNYERGVSCDIIGHGNHNDLNKDIKIEHSTKIVFKKDSDQFATVDIEVSVDNKPKITRADGYVFALLVNGEAIQVADGGYLKVTKGSIVQVVSLAKDGTVQNIPLNVKGWVPSGVVLNNGDDRGYDIVVLPDKFIKRFSVKGAGSIYPIVAEDNKRILATIYLELL